MLLVCVAWLVDPASELHPAALLYNVRGFVRRGVQVGRTAEGYCVTERIRRGAKRVRCGRCRRALVSLNSGHIVRPETRLNLIEMRQPRARPGQTAAGDLGDFRAVARCTIAGARRAALHARTVALLAGMPKTANLARVR